MHILVIAATEAELRPFSEHLSREWATSPNGFFQKGENTLEVCVTGVGAVSTAWGIAMAISRARPDLAINAGIAGALDASLAIGSVYNVVSECFGDLGIEQADGSVQSLFEAGLVSASVPPFSEGKLIHPDSHQMHFLPNVQGVTVNKVHGQEDSIEVFRKLFPRAQVESMEGAAFFYACLSTGIPFMELRSISNYVEKRNRANWNIPLAIQSLNQVLIEMLG
jgi:futalosine hydrolase